MNQTFTNAILFSLPLAVLFVWSLVLFCRKRPFSSLQLLGAVSLLIVLFAHLCEAEHWLPFMHWGEPHSIGHYLDLTSAILGIAFSATGIVLGTLKKKA